MPGGIESAHGRYEHIVAETHLGAVEYHAAGVHEEILPDRDVVTVVAVERRHYREIPACTCEKLPEYLGAPGRIGGEKAVVGVQGVGTFRPLADQFGVVVGIIDEAFEHLLFFCLHTIWTAGVQK